MDLQERSSFSVEISPPATVRVAGDIDLATAPRLGDAIEGLPSGASAVIDMAGCHFIDSAGLNALVNVARHRVIRLSNVCPQIAKTVKLAGVDSVVEIDLG